MQVRLFRAGTVWYNGGKRRHMRYVKKYCEEHEITKRSAEMERDGEKRCVGVRRTTGDCISGAVSLLLPIGEEIYTFTPGVQHPANDMTTTDHNDTISDYQWV